MTASTASTRGRIFISYRREDTAYPAGWIFDRLTQHFSKDQVFKDIDSIHPGEPFAQVITTAVESCDVLLALIGNKWLTIANRNGTRRLDDPEDFVRLEIETALTRNVRVIPVLFDGAQMPAASDLPPSLATLVTRQALELSPDRSNSDMGRLLTALVTEIQAPLTGTDRGPEPPGQPAGPETGRSEASRVNAWADRRTEEGRWLVVHNGSDEPMYSCTLWLITPRMPPRAAGGLPPTDWHSAFTSVIPPQHDYRYLVPADRLQGSGLRMRPPVEIIFRDSHSKWWWRKADGVTEQLTSEQGKNYFR
jgi:TIR domain